MKALVKVRPSPPRAHVIAYLASIASIPCAALLMIGCRAAPTEAPREDAAASSAPLPEPVVSARRPLRRYYLGHVEGRCEIYFTEGDQLSAPLRTPCPFDLLLGERLRIAGKTCTRESPDPERRIPVVCPDPLTNFEKRERLKEK